MGNNEGGFRWGSLAVLVGAALILIGVADRATTEPIDIQVVELHNDRAQTGSGCDARGPSWHFVLAPNNGTFAFHSINLMVAGSFYQFDAGDLIRNSGQRDNVFVRVPDGRSITDLQAAGSFAEVTPGSAERSVRFVLSDVCPGGGSTTTTTSTTSTSVPHSTTTTVPHSTTTSTVPHSTTTSTVPHSTTTSTVPESTTTTTVPESTTTSTTTSIPVGGTTTTTVVESTTTSTVPESTTTSTVPESTTTTTVPESTTTTSVDQRPPTTTSTSTTSTSTTSTSTSTTVAAATTTTTKPAATTTTVPTQSAPTGSDAARPLLMIGAILVLLGASALLGAHVRSTEPR